MGDWEPQRVWDSISRRVREWMGVEEPGESSSNEDEADPAFLFHLAISAPIVIALLILMRRAA